MRELGAGFYSIAAIEAFISHVGTMDDFLIDDGNYLIATIAGIAVGCGGWSTKQATYDTCNAANAVIPVAPKATVRSIYTHPEWTRRGIGRKLMERLECDIRDAGFQTASLTATLSGVPLYRHLGYQTLRRVTLTLPEGIQFEGLKMEKIIGPHEQQRHAA